MDLIRLNIVLYPPKHIREQLTGIHDRLAKVGETEFVLDDRNNFPHITLYNPGYPEKNVRKVINMARHVAQRFSGVKLKLKRVEGSNGYVILAFENTPQIFLLHNAVVKVMNSLREGHLLEQYRDEERFMKLPDEAQQMVMNYGYARVHSAWNPHMTVARFREWEIADGMIRNVKLSIPEFICEELAVFEMGPHGTCVKKVASFQLSNASH